MLDDGQRATSGLAFVGMVAAVLVVLASLFWTALIWFGPAHRWLMPLVNLLGVDPDNPTTVGVVAAGMYFLPRLLAVAVALTLPLAGSRLLSALGYSAAFVFFISDRIGSHQILNAMSGAAESAYELTCLAMAAVVGGLLWLWFRMHDRSLSELEARFAEEDLRESRRPS